MRGPRSKLIAASAWLVAAVSAAAAAAPLPALEGGDLGQGQYAAMHMLLQKTVLNINVATIDGMVKATGSVGKGGYVDTSGHRSLDVVNVPVVGRGGEWHIDPLDITIGEGPDAGVSGTSAIAETISDACVPNSVASLHHISEPATMAPKNTIWCTAMPRARMKLGRIACTAVLLLAMTVIQHPPAMVMQPPTP